MKKTGLFIVIISLVLLASFFTGCKEEGMSIDDRIKEFVGDLNDSNRNGIFKDHFHSDSTSYDGDAALAEDNFPLLGGASYSLISITGSGSTRTVVINNGTSNATHTFTMQEEDEDDWYILSITGGGVTL
jgi:hypothetical protein